MQAHSNTLTVHDPDRFGESASQGAARKRVHSEASSPAVAANGALNPAALPPKKRRLEAPNANLEEIVTEPAILAKDAPASFAEAGEAPEEAPEPVSTTLEPELISALEIVWEEMEYMTPASLCYGCDLGVTYGTVTRKGFRIINGERRTMCHFCFGNIFKLVGGYAHTNYESAAKAPELILGMDRSEIVPIMSNARKARELKMKRKPARNLTECVREAKQAKTGSMLFGYDISDPAFERNLKDVFNSYVQKHGDPGTKKSWKYWKEIGLVALKRTFTNFDKDPRKCTSLGNSVKTKLATLGVLG